MRGTRSHTKKGPLREKRGDTLNKTIEKRYGIDTSMRDDARLDTVLEHHKLKSLHDLIEV